MGACHTPTPHPHAGHANRIGKGKQMNFLTEDSHISRAEQAKNYFDFSLKKREKWVIFVHLEPDFPNFQQLARMSTRSKVLLSVTFHDFSITSKFFSVTFQDFF